MPEAAVRARFWARVLNPLVPLSCGGMRIVVHQCASCLPGSGTPVAALLATAREGSEEALGCLLQGFRQYLLLVANAELDSALKVKFAASDLVQETLLEAQRDFACFAGRSEEEFLAWLRKILVHNLRDAGRHYCESARRAISREVPLPRGDVAARQGAPLANLQTPSWLAMRRESVDRLIEALEKLPDDSRQVIILRNLEALSFHEIGHTMNRSPDAARKLWGRAIQRLEVLLHVTDRN